MHDLLECTASRIVEKPQIGVHQLAGAVFLKNAVIGIQTHLDFKKNRPFGYSKIRFFISPFSCTSRPFGVFCIKLLRDFGLGSGHSPPNFLTILH